MGQRDATGALSPQLLVLKIEEGGHKPRNSGNIEPGMLRKWVFP